MIGPIKRFNTIGLAELHAIEEALKEPLSGYLAGNLRGGPLVRALEDEWADRMGVKYAIACNSATTGLLAACTVCAPSYNHEDIAVPSFTMSATAAAPSIACPNYLTFMDCDPETYCSTPNHCPDTHIGLIIVTDLFGQCAPLEQWKTKAGQLGAMLIEDAAQAPFAMTPEGRLAGTVGDVGVFSLNVHKHMQAGEGGIIVTDNDQLAYELRSYVNHGELRGDRAGLNLRMTELTAAIAAIQLKKSGWVINSRRELAHALSDAVKDFWVPPLELGHHVFYHWAVKVPARNRVVQYLTDNGVPIRAGYVDPLYRHKCFSDFAPDGDHFSAELHDRDLMIFECCSWDPTDTQLKEIGEAFKRAADLVT